MTQAIEKPNGLAAERTAVWAAERVAEPAIFAVQHCASMTEVRAQIDALDNILVPLLVQRVGYMTQAARIKQDAAQVRDEDRIQGIVDRVRKQSVSEGGHPDVLEAIYRSMMEVCIAHEHREFVRLREGATP